MQSANVPWQFLWKNPVLQQPLPSFSTSSTNNEEVVVAAAAAHLTAAEYSSCWNLLKCTSSSKPADGAISTEEITGIESPVGGVVLVQLCSTQDAIILQLFDAAADAIQHERFLQWPSFSENSSRILKDVALCRVALSASSPHNLRPRSLKRQTPVCTAEKFLHVSDALDTLQLLSLGMTSIEKKIESINDSSEINDIRERFSGEYSDIDDIDFMTIHSKNTRVSDVSAAIQVEDDGALLLCVIQHGGTLHWYNLLELLIHDDNKKTENTVAENFASFFLGEDLFPVIQRRIEPLSKTLATVHLSLMKNSMADSTKENARGNRYRPPLLHLDLVDASIEPISSSRRTYANRITGCVTTREYLVIGGCGKRQNVTRKKSKDMKSTLSDASSAGWVTFVSMRPEHNFAQVKSMYLPFAPKSLHYVVWEGMDLLLATNTSLVQGKDQVLAIRMDAGLSPVPCNAPSLTRLSQYSSFADMMDQSRPSPRTIVADSSGVRIRRFEFICVEMDVLYPHSYNNPFNPTNSTYEMTSLAEISVSSHTSPPGIVAVYNTSKFPPDMGVFVELQSFQKIEFGADRNIVLPARRLHGHIAMVKYSEKIRGGVLFPQEGNDEFNNFIPSSAQITKVPASLAACVSGRGWTLLSVTYTYNSQDVSAAHENDKNIFFICWEGEKIEGFSYFHQMNVVSNKHTTSIDDIDVQYICGILPERILGVRHPTTAKARSESFASDIPSLRTDHSHISVQTKTSYSVSARSRNSGDGSGGDDLDELLSALNTLTKTEQESSEKRGQALLLGVESWRSLDGICSQDLNFQVAKEILHCGKNGLIVLSHRRASADPLENYGTHFDTILAWLCRERRDFFMAAYIALLILGDFDCADLLRSLILNKQKMFINKDILPSTDATTHQHILDGLELPPCYGHGLSTAPRGERITPQSLMLKKKSRVADLAFVCLVKGMQQMSPVLSMYLKQNIYYNANQACRVLLGIFLTNLHEYHQNKACSSHIGNNIADVLWPVKSLLTIAVSRNCINETLIFLNAAAPNDLRGITDEDLCTSLVRLVVEASTFAPPILLSLTCPGKDGVQQRYWQSVPHCQKIKLTLLKINDRYPLLFLREVRAFVLDEMNKAINACVTGVADFEQRVPSEWLRYLCIACLSNSNFRWQSLLASANSRCLSNYLSVNEDQFGDHLNLKQHENELLKSAHLSSTFDLNNLDFDATISTLLILQHREQTWEKDCVVSTQALLNYICKLAGGRQLSSRFAFQGSTVMRNCGAIRNVEAAANLIGGRAGFILKCCHVVQMKFLEVNMEEAEFAVLRGDGRCRFHDEYLVNVSAPFELLDYHRNVLQLFDDYVLSVSTFGDFDPDTFSKRGLVDPVFACRVCLRLWHILTAIEVDKTLDRPRPDLMATEWLTDWLSHRLKMDDDENRNGLACAALCRSALWPANGDYDQKYLTGRARTMVMAEELEFSTHFMLSLTQSCRGLVEALPASTVKKTFSGS